MTETNSERLERIIEYLTLSIGNDSTPIVNTDDLNWLVARAELATTLEKATGLNGNKAMNEQEIKSLIQKKITHHRKVFRLLREDGKDEFDAGAIVALITLLDEIEESEKESEVKE